MERGVRGSNKGVKGGREGEWYLLGVVLVSSFFFGAFRRWQSPIFLIVLNIQIIQKLHRCNKKHQLKEQQNLNVLLKG